MKGKRRYSRKAFSTKRFRKLLKCTWIMSTGPVLLFLGTFTNVAIVRVCRICRSNLFLAEFFCSGLAFEPLEKEMYAYYELNFELKYKGLYEYHILLVVQWILLVMVVSRLVLSLWESTSHCNYICELCAAPIVCLWLKSFLVLNLFIKSFCGTVLWKGLSNASVVMTW